jgi:hypothetical protein
MSTASNQPEKQANGVTEDLQAMGAAVRNGADAFGHPSRDE